MCIQMNPILFASSVLDFETDMSDFGCGCPEENCLCGSPTGYWRVAELFLVVFICFPNNYIPYIRSTDYFEYIFVDQCRFLGSLPF